uniref:Uncharacterized protein n=1 Tax=viral metagenome TaxID=1070528 RepID=A0A6C0JS85_9ZZZZ
MVDIFYGVEGRYKNVTKEAILTCPTNNGYLIIPAGDNDRAALFGDPAYGLYKEIVVSFPKYKLIYAHYQEVSIPIPRLTSNFIKMAHTYSNIYKYVDIIEKITRDCDSVVFSGDSGTIAIPFIHGLLYNKDGNNYVFNKEANKKRVIGMAKSIDYEEYCQKYGIAMLPAEEEGTTYDIRWINGVSFKYNEVYLGVLSQPNKFIVVYELPTYVAPEGWVSLLGKKGIINIYVRENLFEQYKNIQV